MLLCVTVVSPKLVDTEKCQNNAGGWDHLMVEIEVRTDSSKRK